VRTFVYTGNIFSVDTWFDGLKSGHTFVSNGPALFLEADGKLPGTEIIKSRGDKTQLILKAISNPGIGNINRLTIYNNYGFLIEKLNTDKLDSLVIKFTHTINKSQWLAAVVYCDNGAIAHTTPIYFIVDGHPTWYVKKAPPIIYRQMEAIKVIEDKELSKKNINQGIIQRLGIAREFYRNLLLKINTEY